VLFGPGKCGVFRGSKYRSGVGDNAVKPYIPRVWLDFLDFLALERDADQFGLQPVASMPKMGKTTIVVTATHANTIVFIVESDSRSNDNVKGTSVGQEAAYGFPNTELVSFELGFGRHFAKCHFGAGAQNGDKNALFCAPTAFDDFSSIDLVLHRQETCDRVADVPGAGGEHALADDVGCMCAFVRGHVAASAQGTLAQ